MKTVHFFVIIFLTCIIGSCKKEKAPGTAPAGATLFWTDSKHSIDNCGTLTITVDGDKTTTLTTSSTSEPVNCPNQTGTAGQGGYILLSPGQHTYVVTSSNGCLSTSGTITVSTSNCNKFKISAPVSILGTWKKMTDQTIHVDSASTPPVILQDVYNNWEGTLTFKTANQFEQNITSPAPAVRSEGTYTLSTVGGKPTIRLKTPINDASFTYTLTEQEFTTTYSENLGGGIWRKIVTKFQRQ